MNTLCFLQYIHVWGKVWAFSHAAQLALINYLLALKSQTGQKSRPPPKFRGRIQADEVTQLATARLFQVAGQFISPLNVLFRNSSLTHKSYLSWIFQRLERSPASAMLNDLWNNLIMMSRWQTDLFRRWSRVMDMSRAALTGGKTVGALEEREDCRLLSLAK